MLNIVGTDVCSIGEAEQPSDRWREQEGPIEDLAQCRQHHRHRSPRLAPETRPYAARPIRQVQTGDGALQEQSKVFIVKIILWRFLESVLTICDLFRNKYVNQPVNYFSDVTIFVIINYVILNSF